ncbi:alpha/beta hydrolase [Actinomycetospora lutea]|uniref:alpha/beta fold hydrolase n=1 Tax=Actinomycetospora lutea TaxID=663604 RepID=UPI002366CE6F|nr:alpha/beta hydrolase [Actinomycetospora lutea]MDD7942396.1 alpha/beta hydrolase [Actinomycetospora lutea]
MTPVAVAVPGLGLTERGWRDVARHLAGTAVVALPAYGLPAGPGPIAPASSADDLVRRLDGLADGPVVLLGHSASCQVVAEAARRHPAAVRGSVLVGPTADPRMSPRPALVIRWLRTAAREDPRRVPAMLRDYLTTRLSGFARALRAARRHDLRETLAGSDLPVLVVRGPHDHLAPSAWIDDLAAVRPGITVVTTRAGAHMVPLTRPEELARVCRVALAG